MVDFMFAVFAALALLGALLMAFHRSVVHSVFALVMSLFGVAGLYWTLGADFLGATQILLYVGGVTVLLLFAVMLTTRETTRVSLLRNVLVAPIVGWLGLSLFGAYQGVQAALAATGHVPPEPEPTTDAIGTALLERDAYLLPFEAVSVLLLVVLIGAVVVARRRPESAS
jgi:NADH-quinone oxidoreductase subunit J